jgi:hypothetical protein
MIWAQAVAALLRAGIAGSEERWDEATFFSESAERLFSQSGMGHFLAVARLRTSQLKGGDEARLNAAQAWMKEQNIRNQSRVANMLAPGRWER